MGKSIFETLSAINCNDKTEKKNGLTYLSWAWAWGIVKRNYPNAKYKVINYDNKPYLFDENLGYLVTTEVTINDETLPMSLPVMDSSNKAQRHIGYTYKVSEWKDRKKTGKMIEKSVYPATMFDINTTTMRCLTKNLAMFGLGHYIYAGEDLPKEIISETEKIGILSKTREKVIGYLKTNENYCTKIIEAYKVDKIENLTDEQIKAINDALINAKNK